MRSRRSYGGGDRDAVIAIVGHARLNPTDTDDDGLPNDWETRFGLDPNDRRRRQRRRRRSRRRRPHQLPGVLANGSHPRGFVITYLAEGATGTFFDTRLAIANPTTTPAHVLSRFQHDDGAVVPLYTDVAPHSRATIDVDTRAEHGAAPTSRR